MRYTHVVNKGKKIPLDAAVVLWTYRVERLSPRHHAVASPGQRAARAQTSFNVSTITKRTTAYSRASVRVWELMPVTCKNAGLQHSVAYVAVRGELAESTQPLL